MRPDYNERQAEEKASPTMFRLKNDKIPASRLSEGFYPMMTRLFGAVLAVILFGSTTPSLLWAEDPIGIQQILEDPHIYHLRHVTLQGTVRDVQALDPYTLPNGTNCYGAYLFRLEDDSSTIPVAVLGICGKPLVRDPEVEDGARVEVSATIQAPSHGGYYLSFRGLKVATEQEGVVQAVADRILPLVE
jgi:hypothetical protein